MKWNSDWISEQILENKDNLILSDKDKNGLDYDGWMKKVQNEYKSSGKLWYR